MLADLLPEGLPLVRVLQAGVEVARGDEADQLAVAGLDILIVAYVIYRIAILIRGTRTMQMVFDAKTYELLESQTTVFKNDKEIVIEKVKFLVDETLPAETQVAWDLSNLQGVTFVDDVPQEVEAEDRNIEQDLLRELRVLREELHSLREEVRELRNTR